MQRAVHTQHSPEAGQLFLGSALTHNRQGRVAGYHAQHQEHQRNQDKQHGHGEQRPHNDVTS